MEHDSEDLLSSGWTTFLSTHLDSSVPQREGKKKGNTRRKKAHGLSPHVPPLENGEKKKNPTHEKKAHQMRIPQDKALSHGVELYNAPDFEPPSDLKNPNVPLRDNGKKKKKKRAAQKKKAKNIPQDKALSNGVELHNMPDFEPPSNLNPYMTQWEQRKVYRGHEEEIQPSIESISALNPYAPVYYEDLVQMYHEGRESPAKEEEPLLINDGSIGRLPIDDHEDEILHNVSRNRVTIIHGETGCGKSSKVPLMLLKDGGGTDPSHVRMFISQPRRIAAQGLMERLHTFPEYKDIIGMRLGHGTKDETPLTRVWFVTAGYLVRLLAHHPEVFDKHSHLVIDEVHERSVDTDVLCLLAKRLLETHPTLRLIVMSATIATEMYRDYFDVSQPAIFVGSRHFPIREIYVDDIVDELCMGPKSSKQATELIKGTQRGQELGTTLKKVQYEMAVQVTRVVGLPGSSVLIFVSGMLDILELIDRFEKLIGGYKYLTIPIHSDLPSDEQMLAFQPAPEGTIKVVIATNAAESSVTLPDVDHVICLGQAKLIQYNPATHRSQLSSCWISKASATQRAGRTGRVRPGTVYRLYARELYEQMDDHEEGEVHRQPLDGMILNLMNMLNQAVIPIFEDMLEPPDMDHIDRSFLNLFLSELIDSPDDGANMTIMGNFVAAMGIDLQFGQLVGLGAQFGCLPEAICMAAVLTVPKLPFRITNPIIHDDPHIYNDIGGKVLLSHAHFDKGLYSDPLMLVQLISVYECMNDRRYHDFCMKWYISHTRFRQLLGTVRSLREKVALNLGINVSALCVNPAFAKSPAKVNILRLLLVWTLYENLIMSTIATKPSKYPSMPFMVNITAEESMRISQEQIRKILPKELQPSVSHNSGMRLTYAANCCTPLSRKDIEKSVKVFVMDELEADCSWVSFKVPDSGYDDSFDLLYNDDGCLSFTEMEAEDQLQPDGVSSKSCTHQGIVLWIRSSQMGLVDDIIDSLNHITSQPQDVEGYETASSDFLHSEEEASVGESSVLKEFRARASKTNLRRIKAMLDRMNKAMCVNISPGQIVVQCAGLKPGVKALQSLFHVESGVTFSQQEIHEKLAVFFPSSPYSEKSQDLLTDTPIGARILNQLAYGYRDRRIKIWEDDRRLKKISLKLEGKPLRWRMAPCTGRLGNVFLPCFSLSAACNPVHPAKVNMYAVAGVMLDLQGGGARADRVTIMPLGEKWISLALLAYGLDRHVNVDKESLSEKKIRGAVYFDAQYRCSGREIEKLEVDMDLIKSLNKLFGFHHNPNDYCDPSKRDK